MKTFIYNEIHDYNLHHTNHNTFLFNIHTINNTFIIYIIIISILYVYIYSILLVYIL